MSLEDGASSESGSPPPPELEENENGDGSRCLITSLPAELLSTIHSLIFSGLSLIDEQLERYRLQSVSRGFHSFFSRLSKELIVTNVDRATPIHLEGKGSGRSDKFAALVDACDDEVLVEVTLELGLKPLGLARAGQGHDWIGLPLRRALSSKFQMEKFKLRASASLREQTLSVDVLEELLVSWNHLKVLELLKIEVDVGSDDACTLLQNLLQSSRDSLLILHLDCRSQQYLVDLIPSIPLTIHNLSCLIGGDSLNSLIKKMPFLKYYDIYSAAVAASSSTTMAILRSVPSLERVDYVLDSPAMDFGPAELIEYFSGPRHVDSFEIFVCQHVRRSNPLRTWGKAKLDEVKKVARAEKIAFTIAY
ncbi:hypothetical protein RQP46_008203 [Phenoliferia psychrophenolica]